MYRIGKIVDTTEEDVCVHVIELEETSFRKKIRKKTKIKALEIIVSGKISDDNYLLHFIINVPLQDYVALNNYEHIRLGNDSIVDSYLTINDIDHTNIEVNIDVTKYMHELTMYLVFQEDNKNFFGEAELAIPIEILKK